jgi:hypothetical protein
MASHCCCPAHHGAQTSLKIDLKIVLFLGKSVCFTSKGFISFDFLPCFFFPGFAIF